MLYIFSLANSIIASADVSLSNGSFGMSVDAWDQSPDVINILSSGSFGMSVDAWEEDEGAVPTDTPTVFENLTIANNSINQPLSFTWEIDFRDTQGDTTDSMIQCLDFTDTSASQNDTLSLSISGLTYNTEYTVFAWANDTNNATAEFYKFTTIPEPAGDDTPTVFEFEDPVNGSTNQSLTVEWKINCNDTEGDTTDSMIQCLGFTDSFTGQNETLNITITGLAYNTEYTVFAWANDTNNETKEFYTFQTEEDPSEVVAKQSGTFGMKVYIEYYIWTEWAGYWRIDYINFGEPTSFASSTYNNSRIDLTWSNHTNATATYIERNTASTWERGEGTEIYNGSSESYSDTGLNVGTHYYYQAWGYNSTQNLFSENPATTDEYTSPADPYDFIVTDIGMNSLELTWTKGTNATNSVIIQNETGWAGFPTTIANGTEVYNNTGSTTTIEDLASNVTYYFSIWSYNPDSANFSDGYASTNETTTASAETPTSLTATTIDDEQINLEWTKGETDYTVIRRNTGSYPTLSTGTEIYNNTGTTYSNTLLTPATHYYYRAWGWNGEAFSEGYASADNISLPSPPTDFVGSIDETTLTITWTKGTGAVRTVLANSSVGYPSDPEGEDVFYNNTGTTKVVSGVSDIDYYTGWSYALVDGVHLYSEATTLLWGGLEINVYKQDNPSIAILNYSVQVTNEDASETWINTSQNNPTRVDVGILPNGENIRITVSKDGYYPQTQIEDLYENAFYQMEFYLVASPTGGGSEGEPDYIPPQDEDTNESDNESYAYLYVLAVQDVYNIKISNAEITAKRYINTTESWDNVGETITDGTGQGEIYLIPYVNYLFSISKAGFNTANVFWTPTEELFTHTFTLIYSNETEPYETLFDNVSYSITPTATEWEEAINITFSVNDTDCQLEYYRMIITSENMTNYSGMPTIYDHNETNITCGGSLSFETNDSTTKYYVTIYIKKEGYDEYFTTKVYYVHPEFEVKYDIGDLIPELLYWIIAVVVTLLATAFAVRLAGGNGVIVSLIVFGIFVALNPEGTIAGISAWWILILMGIVTAILFMLGKGGGGQS